jgi:spermidine/putrescine transport system permease protein
VTQTPTRPETRSEALPPAGAPGGRRRRGGLAGLVFLGPGLLFTAVFVVVPVLLVLSYTVMDRGRFGGVEYVFTLDNLTRAFEPTFRKVLVSSLGIAAAATLIALAIGYPTAYAIARLPERWRSLVLVLVVIPFWTNFLIRTYAWLVLLNTQGVLNDALVRLGLVEDRLDLLYTKGAVIVGLVYVYLPLMVLPIYASVARLDRELVDASADLGASRLTSFLRVTFPLSLPGVVTGCIFVFVPSLGNFVVPELLGGGKTVMVGNLVRDQFLKARDWPFGATLALLMVVLLLVLFAVQSLVSRRYSVEGRR